MALIAEKDCTLPFDIAQMRTIFFVSTNLKSADQCRKDIVAQLSQALEGGAVDSPIATSVDVRALASGSAVERNVAEIVTAIEGIAKSQRTLIRSVEGMSQQASDSGVIEELERPFIEVLWSFNRIQELAKNQTSPELLSVITRCGQP